MSAQTSAADAPRQTLRLAVTAAALSVIGMFAAAATFAGSELQASEAAPVEEISQR